MSTATNPFGPPVALDYWSPPPSPTPETDRRKMEGSFNQFMGRLVGEKVYAEFAQEQELEIRRLKFAIWELLHKGLGTRIAGQGNFISDNSQNYLRQFIGEELVPLNEPVPVSS